MHDKYPQVPPQSQQDHQQSILVACQRWINEVVIHHHFCPFASNVVKEKRINYLICNDIEQVNTVVEQACQQLQQQIEISTTLVIVPDAAIDFDYYLDLLDEVQYQVIQPKYEGTFQLASFHPLYCFADSQPNDAANYTNRSPYPMIHILREDELTQAITNHPDPHSIPERNIQVARSKGLAYMQALLNNIILDPAVGCEFKDRKKVQ